MPTLGHFRVCIAYPRISFKTDKEIGGKQVPKRVLGLAKPLKKILAACDFAKIWFKGGAKKLRVGKTTKKIALCAIYLELRTILLFALHGRPPYLKSW